MSFLFHLCLGYPSDVFTHPVDASIDVVQSKYMEQIPIHTCISHRWNWTWFLLQQLLLHENHFFHRFAAHQPSFCQTSQLFHELFQNCKKRLGIFFFSWFWSFNWTVNILAVLPLLTFDSSLCVFQGWMSVWSTTAAALMCAWTNQSALTASVLLAISSWTERLVAVNKDADGLGK